MLISLWLLRITAQREDMWKVCGESKRSGTVSTGMSIPHSARLPTALGQHEVTTSIRRAHWHWKQGSWQSLEEIGRVIPRGLPYWNHQMHGICECACVHACMCMYVFVCVHHEEIRLQTQVGCIPGLWPLRKFHGSSGEERLKSEAWALLAWIWGWHWLLGIVWGDTLLVWSHRKLVKAP